MTRLEGVQSPDSTFRVKKPLPRKLASIQLQRTLRHKRCKTLIGKSDQLVKLGARVYMVAEVNGRYHVYSSESSNSWPPTEASLSRNYPVPIRYSPQDTDSPVCMKRKSIEENKEEDQDSA